MNPNFQPNTEPKAELPVETKPESVDPAEKINVILFELGQKRFLELIPEATKRVNSLGQGNIVGSFIGDLLAEKNVPGSFSFTRMIPKKQEELLEKATGKKDPQEAIEVLLQDIPEHLVTFYRNKISTHEPNIELDED